MTNEFNNEVQQALNSLSALAVATTPVEVRLQTLTAMVCDVLQIPAARLVLEQKLTVTSDSWLAGTDEALVQGLQESRLPTPNEVSNLCGCPAEQTLRDRYGRKHELVMLPLVIGEERLGAIALAAPTAQSLQHEKSSLLRVLAEQVGLVLLVLKAEKAKSSATRNDSWLTEEFLAMLSHELRAPLHAILGWVSVLQYPTTKPETWTHALKTIERSARAQSAIINDLLDASFCFNQQPNLHKRPVAAQSLVQQVLASVLPLAEQKGITLSSDIRVMNAYLLADGERLRQAFWHLLSNAIKFTPRNGHIQLLAQRMGDHLEVTLADSGIGIAPEFLPHAFDPFRQESAHTTRKFGGLGLGLAIARHQIELHRGTITITSAGKNKGVTVVVHLPLEARLPVKPELLRRESLPYVGGKNPVRKKDLQGLRVLVVDDDADSLEIVSTILQNCNSEVQTAVNAQEALDVLKRWEPDVLISDIQMPGLDGYDLMRQIRQKKPTLRRRIATVALTAYSRAEDRLRALTAGFHTHLAKPVDPTELVAVVRSLATQSQHTFSLS